MTARPFDTPPLNPNVPGPIRECFCMDCGRVAPSWFHRDFVLSGGGFYCIWCCFPPDHCERLGIDPPAPPDPTLYPAQTIK